MPYVFCLEHANSPLSPPKTTFPSTPFRWCAFFFFLCWCRKAWSPRALIAFTSPLPEATVFDGLRELNNASLAVLSKCWQRVMRVAIFYLFLLLHCWSLFLRFGLLCPTATLKKKTHSWKTTKVKEPAESQGMTTKTRERVTGITLEGEPRSTAYTDIHSLFSFFACFELVDTKCFPRLYAPTHIHARTGHFT